MMPLLIFSLSSFIISIFTVGLIKKQFSQLLLDIPNDRSSHTQPTPRGGGLGFIIAFAITSIIATVLKLTSLPLLPLWLVLIPLIIIGTIDDRQGVPSYIRYLVQLLAASIAVAYFGSFPQPWLTSLGVVGQIIAILLTVIGITALINFYNFMDGLDGLVGSVTAVQLSFLAFWFNQPLLWLLVAALLGFLYWNWSPAKIFMGDAGSTVLGAAVAIALLNISNTPIQAWPALCIISPLVGDAIYTLTHRLVRHENIFKAHRSHIYQRLQVSGWSHAQVAITYIVITLLVGLSITLLSFYGALISIVAVAISISLAEIYLKPSK